MTFNAYKSMGDVLKAIEAVLRVLLIVATVSTLIHPEAPFSQDFNVFVYIGFLLYFVSAQLQVMNQRILFDFSLILPIIGLLLTVVAVIMTTDSGFAIYKVALFIAYAWIWVLGSDYDMRHDRVAPIRNRYLITVLSLSVVFFWFFSERFIPTYGWMTNRFYFIYAAVGLLYLNLVNMRSAYELLSKNVMNKSSNVSRFSLLAFVSTLILLMVVHFDLQGLWTFLERVIMGLRDVIFMVLKGLIYPIAWLVGVFVEWIKRFGPGDKGELLSPGSPGSNFAEYEGFMEETLISPQVEKIFGYLIWILMIAVAVSIFFKIYRFAADRKAENHFDGEEERSFVFKIEDFLAPFKAMGNPIKTSKSISLPEFRQAYRKALMDFASKGFKKAPDETPNEYLSSLLNQQVSTDAFEALTKNYNPQRYGDGK